MMHRKNYYVDPKPNKNSNKIYPSKNPGKFIIENQEKVQKPRFQIKKMHDKEFSFQQQSIEQKCSNFQSNIITMIENRTYKLKYRERKDIKKPSESNQKANLQTLCRELLMIVKDLKMMVKDFVINIQSYLTHQIQSIRKLESVKVLIEPKICIRQENQSNYSINLKKLKIDIPSTKAEQKNEENSILATPKNSTKRFIRSSPKSQENRAKKIDHHIESYIRNNNYMQSDRLKSSYQKPPLYRSNHTRNISLVV